MENKLFELFDAGRLAVSGITRDFASLPWNKHAKFEGVELKHIVTAEQTDGHYSYHLVKIAPNKKIGLHTHETQLETHEVIAGTGTCINQGEQIDYTPGTISIFPIGKEHEVLAGENGLYLFAKFFPALC